MPAEKGRAVELSANLKCGGRWATASASGLLGQIAIGTVVTKPGSMIAVLATFSNGSFFCDPISSGHLIVISLEQTGRPANGIGLENDEGRPPSEKFPTYFFKLKNFVSATRNSSTKGGNRMPARRVKGSPETRSPQRPE